MHKLFSLLSVCFKTVWLCLLALKRASNGPARKKESYLLSGAKRNCWREPGAHGRSAKQSATATTTVRQRILMAMRGEGCMDGWRCKSPFGSLLTCAGVCVFFFCTPARSRGTRGGLFALSRTSANATRMCPSPKCAAKIATHRRPVEGKGSKGARRGCLDVRGGCVMEKIEIVPSSSRLSIKTYQFIITKMLQKLTLCPNQLE